ncbi:MAG: hypothetical protein ACRC62_03590 [Microcoleus sp.]
MSYIYPLPTAPAVDTTALNTAIAALQTDETADDKALDDLKKAVEAITVPDVSGFALKADIPSTPDLSPYALKTEIPPAPDLSQYALKAGLLAGDVVTNTQALSALTGKPGEIRHLLSDGRLYKWSAPIPDRLQTSFPAGTGRGAIPIGTSYWSKLGQWLPFHIEYLLNYNWQRAGTLTETIYGCKLTSGTVTDIEYEFSDPADIEVSEYISYSAQHIATWTDSSYWGGKTRFESVTMPSGRVVKAITVIRDDGSVILCSQNNAGTATGFVRGVTINGKFVDTYPVQISDLDSRIEILSNTKQQILYWSTSEQSTGRTWTDGKPTFVRTFTGNTAASGADTRILQVTGSTKIVNWVGWVESSASRKAFMPGMSSGDPAHGPMFQFYTATDLRSYHNLTDTRWNSRPFEITVEYCK